MRSVKCGIPVRHKRDDQEMIMKETLGKDAGLEMYSGWMDKGVSGEYKICKRIDVEDMARSS